MPAILSRPQWVKAEHKSETWTQNWHPMPPPHWQLNDSPVSAFWEKTGHIITAPYCTFPERTRQQFSLHTLSFLNTMMAQAIQILPPQGHIFPTCSMSLWLMTWRHLDPGDQHIFQCCNYLVLLENSSLGAKNVSFAFLILPNFNLTGSSMHQYLNLFWQLEPKHIKYLPGDLYTYKGRTLESMAYNTGFSDHQWPAWGVIILNSIMMLVKFLTSANQKHWIWSCDELCNPWPRLLGDEVVVCPSLMFKKKNPWNVIRNILQDKTNKNQL